jgi:hypothetical protein
MLTNLFLQTETGILGASIIVTIIICIIFFAIQRRTDGTIIQKSTSTEAKIKFIDENGVSYFLKAGIPLSELIKVAESLR